MTFVLIFVVTVWLVWFVHVLHGVTMKSEIRFWLVALYWALYWFTVGPYLVSLDNTLAVALGFALFFVGLRFTLPPIKHWLEKDL